LSLPAAGGAGPRARSGRHEWLTHVLYDAAGADKVAAATEPRLDAGAAAPLTGRESRLYQSRNRIGDIVEIIGKVVGMRVAAGVDAPAGREQEEPVTSPIRTLAVAAAAIVLTSCGGSSSPASPSGPGTPSSPAINIVGQVGAQAFTPNPAPLGGQAIVFHNNDSVTHRVILNDGSGDTGDIAPGATSRTVTIPANGANYHCTIHPGMGGSVGPSSGAAPPPCEGIYCY
jgi:plastocyanin